MKNIWKTLKKPIFILAPMDDVTDVVFRQVVNKTARPDLFFTEFTNVEGLNSSGKEVLLRRLRLSKLDHPIIAQIWGIEPENYKKAARLIKDLGFDGIDINMGCPVRAVTRNGACSALIKNQELARAIIEKTIEGAGELPVSVKTRIGFSTVQTEEWISFLLQFKLSAIIVHGRTAKEQSTPPANWDEIQKAVELRDRLNKNVLIIGNGDVVNRQDGLEKIKKYGVDGVMIGRGIFKDVWAFAKVKQQKDLKEMLALALLHIDLFEKEWGNLKSYNILKRFFKIYTTGFDRAKEIREKLYKASNYHEAKKIIIPNLT